MGPNLQRTVKKIVKKCDICAKNDPETGLPPVLRGIPLRGTKPGDDWLVDFTIMPQTIGILQYLLVFINTLYKLS